MKLRDCLPLRIRDKIIQYYNGLREIRLRQNSAIRINVGGVWYYIADSGKLVKQFSKDVLLVTDEEITELVLNACNKSVYAVERQLVEGYLTLEDGCRIGVSGPVSCNSDGNVVCFSSYTSVCIRIAHYVACSGIVDNQIIDSNILVVGKPSSGKTTFLRDLASRASMLYNVTIVDERGELSGCDRQQLANADVLLFADKSYAFSVAVRSLAPDIVAMDELQPNDFAPLKNLMDSGVKVFATLHGAKLQDIDRLLSCGVKFHYYVILDDKVGNLAKLYSQSEVDRIL